MSIPSGIGTAVVHIDAPVSYTGDPGRVHISIAASVPLVWAATGTPLANFVDSFTPGVGTDMSAQLPWTDQSGFIDGAGNAYTNWSYLAQITYEKDGQLVVFPDRSFQIPSGQTSLDLSLVPAGPSVPAVTAPILPVTDVGGLNGSVSLAELGLDFVTVLVPDPAYPGLYILTTAATLGATYDGGSASSVYASGDLIDGGGA